MNDSRVLVIGAGVSGLTCAYRLQQAGIDALVLEASDRVGGRTRTVRSPDGVLLEGGGQWFGPGQTAVLQLIDELGLETTPTYTHGRTVFRLRGRTSTSRVGVPFEWPLVTLDLSIAITRLQMLAARVNRERPWTSARAAGLDRTTFDEWLTEHTRTVAARHIFDAVSALTLGGDPRDLSLLGVLQHIRSAGGLLRLIGVRGGAQDRRLITGAQSISTSLADRMPGRVLLETPAKQIEWDANTATVRAAGHEFRASAVVVAMCPIDRGHIDMVPELPPIERDRIALSAQYSGIKVHAVYPTPFWRARGFNGQAVSDVGPAPVVFDNSPADDRVGVLSAFVAGTVSDHPASPTIEQILDPDVRRVGVLECFAELFGDEARHPTYFTEVDWRAEPYIEGCIPSVAPGVLTATHGHSHGTGRLVWAGTEQSDVWNGYIDGAVRAGERAAAHARQLLH